MGSGSIGRSISDGGCRGGCEACLAAVHGYEQAMSERRRREREIERVMEIIARGDRHGG